MDSMQRPEPMPQKRHVSYGTKMLLLGLQCGMLMVGAVAIWLLSYSRDERSNDVAGQIAGEWGGAVYISGPMAGENPDSSRWCRPEIFSCDATVDSKLLHRNIYEADVFNARISMSGAFNKECLASSGDSIYIKLCLNARQLAKLSELKIGGTTVQWNRYDSILCAEVDIKDMPQKMEFSTEFDIRGSSALFIEPIGDKSSVSIDGEASNPSFRGRRLPDERSLDGRRFSARWGSYEAGYKDDCGYIGANFLVGVDRYQKVVRSLKYAFIIILLTYISVLSTEIAMKKDIPLLNYLLIGAALIIFYILLLSFSEQVSFAMAYIIASVMTVGLIAGYIWKMLNSGKAAGITGMVLTCLYLSCYILLSLSTYALLLGSLMLFFLLAAMMYASLKINRI